MPMRVIVVGGGITGLVAARKLQFKGVAVTLIDRTFPFGGRFRPERVEVPGYGQAVFDPRPVFLGPAEYGGHPDAPLGFPPLGLQPDEFTPQTRATLRSFPVARLRAGNGQLLVAPSPRVTIPGGAKSLIDLLIPPRTESNELIGENEVTALEPDGHGWRVRVRECSQAGGDDQRTRFVRADAVLLTQPIPLALELLDTSRVEVSDPLRDELRRVRYERTITVTAAYRGTSLLPGEGGVSFSDSPLALVFDNYQTGTSPTGPAMTAVASAAWAAEHWHESDEEITRRLLPLIAPWASGELVWHRVQRRSHNRATGRMRMPFAEVADIPPLVIAGDGFASYVPNPLDAAYTSASHAVTHLCRGLSRVARIVGCRTPRTPTRVSVEVAISSAEEATLAIANGADRLFLLAAPEVGGLTPSFDTYLAVCDAPHSAAGREVRIPVTVLLRPRLGDCVYHAGEVAQLLRDARRFLAVGADAVAFGALTGSGVKAHVHAEACRPLVELAHAHRKQAVFHRAFDVLRDRRTGLQDLIALGFDRLITAGRSKLADDSVSDLSADVAYAGWDIDVVAAGGIGPGTVGYVHAETSCPGVLLGVRRTSRSRATKPRRSFESHRNTHPDWNRVAETVAVLRRIEQGGGTGSPDVDPDFGDARETEE